MGVDVENKVVRFTIPGEPAGKGRPRFSPTSGSVRTPENTVNYETMVKWYYKMASRGFKFPDNAMLDMRIYAYYSIPKSDSKKKKQAKLENRIRPMKKPDMDNVCKIVADALNAIAYHDDTQIVDVMVRKFFSDQPRVVVTIQEVGDPA